MKSRNFRKIEGLTISTPYSTHLKVSLEVKKKIEIFDH